MHGRFTSHTISGYITEMFITKDLNQSSKILAPKKQIKKSYRKEINYIETNFMNYRYGVVTAKLSDIHERSTAETTQM